MGEKLGMIGLGKMGLPLARNMIADGHAVCGYDVDSTRMNLLEDAGGRPVPSAKQVAEESDITFSILMRPEHIEANTLGPHGIAEVGKRGLVHVEMSTMHPTWQRTLTDKLAARGIDMLDAPISGSHNRVDAGPYLSWSAARRPFSSASARSLDLWPSTSPTPDQADRVLP